MNDKVKKELICIACPVGCRLDVQYLESGSGEVTVIGNVCNRGEAYAREEITAPKRTVTAVVKTNSQTLPFAPVRTDKPLPVSLINDLLKKIYSAQSQIPILAGDVLVEDFSGSGVNVVFTRNIFH